MSSPAALAPLTIRLRGEKRLELAQRLMDLVGAALLLRHDEAEKLVRLQRSAFYESRTDQLLLRGIASLTAFVRDRAEDGITLPEWHPCYASAPDGVEVVRPWAMRGGE